MILVEKMKKQQLCVGILSLLLLALPLMINAQQIISNNDPAPTINAQHQADIIDSVSQAINTVYVFPDVAKEMEKLIRKNYKKGEYKKITDLMNFTKQLTLDLRSVSHDLHLRVGPMPPEEALAMENPDPIEQEKWAKRQMEARRAHNYDFKKIEILPGNIGYLDLRGFNDASFAAPTAIAAMKFLSSSDALIFDLRQNGGGSPSMIQLLTSYLLEEATHINSFYIRAEDSIKQFWTTDFVDGTKMTDIPVYVLTSNYTFSAAEEFTYNLKNLKRATIIGQTTGGGAHPVDHHYFRITDDVYIQMSLPFGRAINPITGTNWEGTGIAPHIEVEVEKALDVAQLEALKSISEGVEDEDRKFSLDWAINGLNSKLNPITLEHNVLANYTGSYGPRKVTLENGKLYYQRDENPKFELTPISNNMFAVGDLEYFRIEFIAEMGGPANKLVGHYDNGRIDANERDI